MSALKQWAFAVCAAMVACGIAGMILPKSNMEKMFRVVTSIFFLCCLLAPFALRVPDLLEGIDISLDTQAEQRARQLSETAGEQALRLVEDNLRNLMAENLAESGINVVALTINIVTNGQNEEELQSVLVRLDSGRDREEELTRQLEELLGVPVELEFV